MDTHLRVAEQHYIDSYEENRCAPSKRKAPDTLFFSLWDKSRKGKAMENGIRWDRDRREWVVYLDGQEIGHSASEQEAQWLWFFKGDDDAETDSLREVRAALAAA